MHKERLSFFRYAYQQGPRSVCHAEGDIQEGNCRLVLQDYFLVFHGKFFTERELLNPEAYFHTGTFLKDGPSDDFFVGLPTGAVVYAERARSKDGRRVAKAAADFACINDYLVSLHSAIFIQATTAEVLKKFPAGIGCLNSAAAIWHATSIEGETCWWPLERFLFYYRPVAAKSFVVPHRL